MAQRIYRLGAFYTISLQNKIQGGGEDIGLGCLTLITEYFFVRMLGKLLEFTGIEYTIQDGGSPFKLAEHAQLIIFCQAA